MSTVAVNVKIRGQVQGVWFRAWTVQNAKEIGISGWVRNCRDGSVEAVFSGDQQLVDQMLARCHHGPSAAVVQSVTFEEGEFAVEGEFMKRPTI